MRHVLFLYLLIFSGSACAVPVLWTLQDVVFDDGGTLTGSFIFDVDSDTVVVDYFHPESAWVQPFYFDVEIVATPGNGNNPFDSFWGYYSTDYVGEVVGYCDPSLGCGNPPLPTADGADYQNGLTGRIIHDCVVTYCDRSLILNFDQPLTNAGGTVALSGYEDVFITDPPYSYFDRTIVSGTLFGVTVVPIPAAVWLFGSGLGLLGWIRRRKTA
jgi:hypothetical protein